jgi:hypothetical protein
MADDVNSILEQMGIETSGMPRGTSANSNINLYENMVGLVGNPVFLLQQGLIGAKEFQQTMRMLASVPVVAEEYDYQTLQDAALEDEFLAEGFDLIKNGYSVDRVLRYLKEASRDSRKFDASLFRNDLQEFKTRWDKAQTLESMLASGEIFEQEDGTFRKRLSLEDAAKVYKSYGLPGYLQNPLLYEVVPDPELFSRALSGEKEAKTLMTQLDKVSRSAGKSATKAAKDVYSEFMAAGKRGEEAGITPRTGDRSEYEASIFAPTLASRSAASPPVAGGRSGMDAQAMAKFMKDRYAASRPPVDANAALIAKMSPAEREVWAKAAQTYAGKSELALNPELQKVSKDVSNKLAEVERLKSQAVQRGSIPALDILSQGLPVAGAFSTPQPRARAERPAPRVLSDEEIESMASMIAGGIL